MKVQVGKIPAIGVVIQAFAQFPQGFDIGVPEAKRCRRFIGLRRNGLALGVYGMAPNPRYGDRARCARSLMLANGRTRSF